MKKVLSALLAAAMIFSVGCSQKTNSNAQGAKGESIKPETLEVQLIPSKDAAKLDA